MGGLDKTDTIAQAEQICRAVCVRHALARFLQLSPDQLDDLDVDGEGKLSPDLSVTLNALVGDETPRDLFSDDQRQLLSIALQLNEQEVLYLLECAANRGGELGLVPA